MDVLVFRCFHWGWCCSSSSAVLRIFRLCSWDLKLWWLGTHKGAVGKTSKQKKIRTNWDPGVSPLQFLSDRCKVEDTDACTDRCKWWESQKLVSYFLYINFGRDPLSEWASNDRVWLLSPWNLILDVGLYMIKTELTVLYLWSIHQPISPGKIRPAEGHISRAQRQFFKCIKKVVKYSRSKEQNKSLPSCP